MMEYTFTLSELWAICLAVLSAIVLVGNAGKVVAAALEQKKKPEARLADLNARLTKVERKLDNDDARLQKLEEGNRVLLEANLALLKHGIDGNEVHAMESAQSKVTDFLLNK